MTNIPMMSKNKKKKTKKIKLKIKSKSRLRKKTEKVKNSTLMSKSLNKLQKLKEFLNLIQ